MQEISAGETTYIYLYIQSSYDHHRNYYIVPATVYILYSHVTLYLQYIYITVSTFRVSLTLYYYILLYYYIVIYYIIFDIVSKAATDFLHLVCIYLYIL